MTTELSHILSYLNYLSDACSLAVSVHFSEAVLSRFAPDEWQKMKDYNFHKHAYCTAVKKDSHARCVAHQKALIGCACAPGTVHACYAGVREAVYPFFGEDTCAGYVAVSGFRRRTPPENCIAPRLWLDLSAEEPPKPLCDALLPPLCLMLENYLIQHPGRPQNEFNAILQYLNEYHASVTLEDLSERFGRSKSYLSHAFRRESGKTLRAYCNDLKLEDARRILLTSDRPITEIALDAGFNDVSYFIAQFRKKFGATPMKYRNLH